MGERRRQSRRSWRERTTTVTILFFPLQFKTLNMPSLELELASQIFILK